MLKNDTLKNETSRISLYGSASPGQHVHGRSVKSLSYESHENVRVHWKHGLGSVFTTGKQF